MKCIRVVVQLKLLTRFRKTFSIVRGDFFLTFDSEEEIFGNKPLLPMSLFSSSGSSRSPTRVLILPRLKRPCVRHLTHLQRSELYDPPLLDIQIFVDFANTICALLWFCLAPCTGGLCPFPYFEIGLFWTTSENVVTSFLVAANDALSWSFLQRRVSSRISC